MNYQRAYEKQKELIRLLSDALIQEAYKDMSAVGGLKVAKEWNRLSQDIHAIEAEEEAQPELIVPSEEDTSHLCTLCHKNWVDSENGFDTCEACVKEF